MLHRQILQGASAERSILFLHGILGRGQNWRSIAQRFVEAKPSYAAVLVDLRAHGDSLAEAPPDTLAACASDLASLDLPFPITAVLGHSFGGKVALTYAEQHPCASFIVDSTPSARPDKRGSESVSAVLDALRALPATFENRRSFTHQLVEAHSIPRPTAMWLAMNLHQAKSDDKAMSFSLNLDRIDALLADYFARDLWSAVNGKTVFIVGEKSDVVSPADLARAQNLGATTRVVAEAAHWIHVDAPDALTDILVELAK